MRTTVTLDPDVAAKVKSEMKKSDLTFKQAVNNLIRKAPNSNGKKPVNPFTKWARPLGFKLGNEWNSASKYLDKLDLEIFIEKQRRMDK